jgi:hypothetical protein
VVSEEPVATRGGLFCVLDSGSWLGTRANSHNDCNLKAGQCEEGGECTAIMHSFRKVKRIDKPLGEVG